MLPGSWHMIECAVFVITGQFCAGVVLLLLYFFKVAKSNYDVLRMAAEPLCIHQSKEHYLIRYTI